MKPLLILSVLVFLVSTGAILPGKCNPLECKRNGKGGCKRKPGQMNITCGSCLPPFKAGATADDPCLYKACKADAAQCITAHRENCGPWYLGLCGDCVSGYVGLEGPAYPNATCVKSNDPPAINDLITQILLTYDCTTALVDPQTFKANLKAEFCSVMEQADCDRLVFGDPKCASGTTAAEVSSVISVQDTGNTIVDMTVEASAEDGAVSAKAILMTIDQDMSDPENNLRKGALMSTADTTTSLLSKATSQQKFRCKGGTLATSLANCPPRQTTTTLSVNTVTAVYGQTVILNAAITIAVGAGTNPVGQVIFKNNNQQIGDPVSVNAKKAVLNYKVTIGQNKITASYIEDDQFYGSNSIAKTITAGRAWTKINVTSSKNPSIKGQAIILTFTVTPTLASITAIPTGKVKIFDGGKLLQVITLSQKGIGSLTMSNFAKGTHTITAQYQGNTYFKKSTTKTALSQRVN